MLKIISNNLNIQKILNILPHRYPFLLIDRVIDFKVFKYLHAFKNCTINESCFQGHFFETPIFPGVLIVESMVQSAAVLLYKSIGKLNINTLYYLVGIDNTRFKKIVIPGDQIFIEVFFLKRKKNLIKFKIIAIVNKNIVCKSTIMFSEKPTI